MNLNTIRNLISSKASRVVLKAGKHSPEALAVVGIAAVISGTVLACKATIKAKPIIEGHTLLMADIKDVSENMPKERYSSKDYFQDKLVSRVQFAVKMGKVYIVPGLLITGGLGCLLGAQGILKSRNLALAAAYKALDESFNRYRENVREVHGEEEDATLKRGETIIHKEDPDTKDVVPLSVVDPNKMSVYARLFDESSSNWQRNAEYNLMFLKSQESYANQKLQAQGHLFLNEVYDMLDIPRSKAGAVVGWAISKSGDNYVDFGIYDTGRESARDFVNGYEKAVLLDFNVDGVIYDLI